MIFVNKTLNTSIVPFLRIIVVTTTTVSLVGGAVVKGSHSFAEISNGRGMLFHGSLLQFPIIHGRTKFLPIRSCKSAKSSIMIEEEARDID